MRDIAKAVQDYNSLMENNKSRAGEFYPSDIEQIRTLTSDPCEAIIIALEAGFMEGYRTAQKQRR